MTPKQHPDAENTDLVAAYAATLYEVVSDDLSWSEHRIIKDWTELHAFRDANEYLILADEKHQLLSPFDPDPNDPDNDLMDDDLFEAYNVFVGAAIAIAERRLFNV